MGDVEGIFSNPDDMNDDLDAMGDLDSDELMDPLEIDLESESDEDLGLGLDLEGLDDEDDLLFGNGDSAEG